MADGDRMSSTAKEDHSQQKTSTPRLIHPGHRIPGADPSSNDKYQQFSVGDRQKDFKHWRDRHAYTSTVEWHKWRHDSWKPNGRVFIIDYVLEEDKFVSSGKEFHDIDGLRSFYGNSGKPDNHLLRLIHVQNAKWATRYLMNKFNIDHRDDLVGTDFAKWVRFDKPEWRAGKPHLKGRSWRTQRDPWRGIRRTAFGVDYLKAYSVRGGHWLADDVHRNDSKMMELNCYDENDNPTYGHDTIVQRLSCYVQHADGDPTLPTNDTRNPYAPSGQSEADATEAEKGRQRPRTRFPPLEELDNGNAVILFENSYSGSVEDTLVQARNQIESRWCRLQFYLRRDELTSKTKAALDCINLILSDIFKGISVNWEHFLGICETHVSILEDKIYQSPADESRAPELWANSNGWLRVEKLMLIHLDIVRELIGHLEDLPSEANALGGWIDNTYEGFQRLSNSVQEGLIKPTTNLNDLLYKSVEIRDARHSIQLGTSMWRLSWITFIFLPLTFLVSFFGMNVDTFKDLPSIKWYFAAAVPLMLLVICAWYVVKHYLVSQQRTPYQRGVYEHLYRDLAISHPELWTRNGPRETVNLVRFKDRLKWRLLSRWFNPDRTIWMGSRDPDEDAGSSDLGVYARFKRRCARKWLGEIAVDKSETLSALEAGETHEDQNIAVTELLQHSAPITVAQGEPSTHPLTQWNLEHLHPALEGRRSSFRGKSDRRESSEGASSAAIVEERVLGEDNDTQMEEDQTYVQKTINGMMGMLGTDADYDPQSTI